jgi:hypothetical protein
MSEPFFRGAPPMPASGTGWEVGPHGRTRKGGSTPPPLPASRSDDHQRGQRETPPLIPPPLPVDPAGSRSVDGTLGHGSDEAGTSHAMPVPSSAMFSVPNYLPFGVRRTDSMAIPQATAVNTEKTADGPVDPLAGLRRYAGGFASFIVHVIVLLVLAFLAVPRDTTRPLAIVIDTALHEDALEVEEVPVELPDMGPDEELEPHLPDVADIPLPPVDDLAALVDDMPLMDPLVSEQGAVVDLNDLVANVPGARGDERGGDERGGGGGHGRGGFGGEVGRRLARAGAQTGDVQISLAWDNVNDIDLHVIAPSGERIFYGHRQSRCGGRLDVDMNVAPTTPQAVENVFWPRGRAPRGFYTVYVHHFRPHVRLDPTAFEVHVLVRGRKAVFRGIVAAGQRPVLVARFTRDGKGLTDEAALPEGPGGS